LSLGYLDLSGLTKTFGTNVVLDAFSLSMAKGEFITLLGPSGCGKTTLLRLIAGLLRQDSGSIRVEGRELTRLSAHRRNVGIVFQSYALFPHLDVRGNIAFGLKAKGMAHDAIEREVSEALKLVQLQDFGDRSVKALSGGQQQRVSLARAMVTRPAVMLLDEPFSALDRKLRETMQIETRQILRRIGATAIFVTHDQEEALVLSDRVVVMNHGRVEQIGDPKTVYARPASAFVLGFVGQALRLQGTVNGVSGGKMAVRTEVGLMRALGGFREGQKVMVAARPESVELGAAGEDHNGAVLKVRELVFLGSKTQVLFESAGEDVLMAELAGVPPSNLQPGATVPVRWPVDATLSYAS
jgi:putative spermidine/putrescine transport system ATP-binding protein